MGVPLTKQFHAAYSGRFVTFKLPLSELASTYGMHVLWKGSPPAGLDNPDPLRLGDMGPTVSLKIVQTL
jgi:hypothetical protein